jgi:hypothetical protein
VKVSKLKFNGSILEEDISFPKRKHTLLAIIGVVLIGIEFVAFFQPVLNQLFDTFSTYAASHVVAMTFSRFIVVAGFPLTIVPLLRTEGIA